MHQWMTGITSSFFYSQSLPIPSERMGRTGIVGTAGILGGGTPAVTGCAASLYQFYSSFLMVFAGSLPWPAPRGLHVLARLPAFAGSAIDQMDKANTKKTPTLARTHAHTLHPLLRWQPPGCRHTHWTYRTSGAPCAFDCANFAALRSGPTLPSARGAQLVVFIYFHQKRTQPRTHTEVSCLQSLALRTCSSDRTRTGVRVYDVSAHQCAKVIHMWHTYTHTKQEPMERVLERNFLQQPVNERCSRDVVHQAAQYSRKGRRRLSRHAVVCRSYTVNNLLSLSRYSSQSY